MKNFNSTARQVKKTSKKEQLAERIAQEIISREYTQKEIDTMINLINQGKQEEAKKVLFKDCFCQKEAKTWQERMSKAQSLLQLAEKEGNEAEQLRVKETSHLLSNYFKRQYE